MRPSSEWGEALWTQLRSEQIPCAMLLPRLPQVTLLNRLPFVTVEPELAHSRPSWLRQIPLQKLLTWSEDIPPVSAVNRAFRERFGEDLSDMHRGCLRLAGAQVLFRGIPLDLTSEQRCIVNLLVWCGSQIFSAGEIALLCLPHPSPDAAVVQISRINHQAQVVSPYKMSGCTRYKGYHLL